MFQVGELVKWYEVYGDIMITKDTGLGIIMTITDICYGNMKQTLYKVYRSEKQDTIVLEEHCVEKLHGEK